MMDNKNTTVERGQMFLRVFVLFLLSIVIQTLVADCLLKSRFKWYQSRLTHNAFPQ